MEFISSRENKNIKLYQKLSSNKKARMENGLFVLEGLRLCIEALEENAELYCMYITTSARERYSEAVDLLIKKNNEKIFIITDELGGKLADTKDTQGVFAIVAALDKSKFNCTICNSGKYIALNNLQDPGNVGTILRTADALGITGIILCNCCDIYNPKVIRSSMGSIFRLNIIEDEISAVITTAHNAGLTSFAAVIDEDAISLKECNFNNGALVVIGNEGNGLPLEIVNMCQKKVTIKMSTNANSLNAAMATGIIMWEMLR